MEFAEWAVSGLERLRLGQLPGGNGFYQAVSAGLGGDPRLDAYMNSGDPGARAELVRVIAQAAAANPGLEQYLRQAAVAAQAPAKPSFFKTTKGILALVAAVVVVGGGGVGLAVGLSGGGGDLAGSVKGTWSCASYDGVDSRSGIVLTIGDGTWSVNGMSGTWKQDGQKVTLTEPGKDLVITNVPTGTGSIDSPLTSDQGRPSWVRLRGDTSSSVLNLIATLQNDTEIDFHCTK